MKLYPIKTPSIVQRLFPEYTWCFSSVPKNIYLTFDDGPTPEVTDFVLEELKKYNAKATFFCIGKNVKSHRHLYEKILNEGHSVGNHTFNHLNGFKTKNTTYIENVVQASAHIDSNLFRPPYGKLKSSQGKALQKKGYKVIMWNVLSADFDLSVTPERCFRNVLNHATRGSIVVMHDSIKAQNNVFYTLPRILEHFTNKGYKFKAIG